MASPAHAPRSPGRTRRATVQYGFIFWLSTCVLHPAGSPNHPAKWPWGGGRGRGACSATPDAAPSTAMLGGELTQASPALRREPPGVAGHLVKSLGHWATSRAKGAGGGKEPAAFTPPPVPPGPGRQLRPERLEDRRAGPAQERHRFGKGWGRGLGPQRSPVPPAGWLRGGDSSRLGGGGWARPQAPGAAQTPGGEMLP